MGSSPRPASRSLGAPSGSALPAGGTLLPRGDAGWTPPFPREVPALQPLPQHSPLPRARGPGPEHADLLGPPPHLGSLPCVSLVDAACALHSLTAESSGDSRLLAR